MLYYSKLLVATACYTCSPLNLSLSELIPQCQHKHVHGISQWTHHQRIYVDTSLNFLAVYLVNRPDDGLVHLSETCCLCVWLTISVVFDWNLISFLVIKVNFKSIRLSVKKHQNFVAHIYSYYFQNSDAFIYVSCSQTTIRRTSGRSVETYNTLTLWPWNWTFK